MTLPQDKLTYRPEDVAELLNLGRNSVYALIRTGTLRSVRVGRKILIPSSAIADFLSGEQNLGARPNPSERVPVKLRRGKL